MEHRQADRALASWLREPGVGERWAAAVRGRVMLCDCDAPACHVPVVRARLERLEAMPRPLEPAELRKKLSDKLRGIKSVGQVPGVLLFAASAGGGGLVEVGPLVSLPDPCTTVGR